MRLKVFQAQKAPQFGHPPAQMMGDALHYFGIQRQSKSHTKAFLAQPGWLFYSLKWCLC
jgi:hypothetical protein